MVLTNFAMLSALWHAAPLIARGLDHVDIMSFKCYYAFTKTFGISRVLHDNP